MDEKLRRARFYTDDKCDLSHGDKLVQRNTENPDIIVYKRFWTCTKKKKAFTRNLRKF